MREPLKSGLRLNTYASVTCIAGIKLHRLRYINRRRKNALFAGSDGGGEHWAIIASLVETCKLSGVDPQAYLEDTLTKIVNGHLNTEIDELLPWSYAAPAALKDVA